MSSKRFFLGQQNKVDGSLAAAVKCLSAKKEKLGISLWSDSPSSFVSSARSISSLPHRPPSPVEPLNLDEKCLSFLTDDEEPTPPQKTPVSLFKPLRISSPHVTAKGAENEAMKERNFKGERSVESNQKLSIAMFQSFDDKEPPLRNGASDTGEENKENEEQQRKEQPDSRSVSVSMFEPLGDSVRSCRAAASRRCWESSEDDSGFERFLARARPKEEEEEAEEEEEPGLSDFIVPDDEVVSDECVDSGSDEEEAEEEEAEEEEKDAVRTGRRNTRNRRGVLAAIFSSEEETEEEEEEEEEQRQLPRSPKLPEPRKMRTPRPEVKEISAEDSPSAFLLSLAEKENAREGEVSKFVLHFKKHREELTKTLFRLFNLHVFSSKLPGDMTVEWSARLTKTAGHCKCYFNRATQVRSAKVRLSAKVCSSAERARDTLLHELCHAATWLIDHNLRAGHGPLWKAWTRRVAQRFPRLPPVTTTHAYVIFTKFTYRCTSCGAHVNRHSRSVDTERMVCSLCRGKFELVVNTPGRARGANPFAEFVKENYADAKREAGSHADAMRELSKRFSALKTRPAPDGDSF